MKLSQKTKRILIVALAVAIAVALVFVGISHIQNRKHRKEMEALRQHYVAYDACKEDLNALVDFLQIIYSDPQERPDQLLVASDSLMDYEKGKISMPDELHTSIKTITQKGFVSDKVQWRLITFDGKRIQLDVLDGNYALVYSPGGQPDYLHSPNEGYDILVEHIEGNWYHVIRMN